LRKAIEDETVIIEKDDIKVTMSIGISEYMNKDHSIEEALSRVDEALYQAKKHGRNRVVVY
jgi:diguanylate cyclase